MRRSLLVVPEKFWKVVTQLSAIVGGFALLEEPVILVLLSDPRLLVGTTLKISGATRVLVLRFIVTTREKN